MARARFFRIVADALNHFKVMGTLTKWLTGREWLEVLHSMSASRYPKLPHFPILILKGISLPIIAVRQPIFQMSMGKIPG